MPDSVTSRDTEDKEQIEQPKKNTKGKKFENVAKNVVGPATFLSKNNKQKVISAYSKVTGYVSEYTGNVSEYFSNKERNKTKRRKTARRGSSKKEPNNKRQQICIGVFFLGLLVIVFVGSSVGFSKCEAGFRKVQPS